jgi:hypothetical protein
MPETQLSSRARKPVMRITFIVIGLFTAWHLFASFLWISPPTPLRNVVPGNVLTSYMIPWFGQSWSVFAPAPINGDFALKVRATLKDAQGNETVTRWVDATNAELSQSRYNLLPPRAATLATHQASLLFNSWSALNAQQQGVAALNYYKSNDWLGRMQIAMNTYGQEAAVIDYIVQERYTDAYATQVANAMWGKDKVELVQYQVFRQNVIPFEERHVKGAKRPGVQLASTGWRGLIVMPGQSADDFKETFLAAVANSGQKR